MNIKKNKTHSAAYYNIMRIQDLLNGKPISLACSEETYPWGTAEAYASTSPGDKTKDGRYSHPFISYIPSVPKHKQFPTETEEIELKRTIFHEIFHNIGSVHGKDIEYAYACEDCCIWNDETTDELTKIACKICTGANYNGVDDPNYLKDFVDYASLAYIKGSPSIYNLTNKSLKRKTISKFYI